MLIGLGIDPGPKGALALIEGTSAAPTALNVYDMPTHTITVAGKPRERVDMHGLSTLLETMNFAGINLALIEDLSGREVRVPKKIGNTLIMVPQAGQFQQGFAAALPVQAAVCHAIPLRMIPPAAWKKALGCPADKEEARLYASRLLPRFADQWPLKKHDGRAEAALLSLYALKILEGTT